MNIKTAKRINTVKEYYFSTKLKELAALRESGKDIINLGIGSPDLSPAEEVISELIAKSIEKGNHAYQSYSGIPSLREAFAKWYSRFFDVDLDYKTEILPLAGSKEGIMHISMTYLEEGDCVLVPNPGYPAYRAVGNLGGAEVIDYYLSAKDNWLIDLKKLEEKDLTKVKMMWVNYPHMPTGAKATKDFFRKIIDFGKKHEILIVNDNPYSFILNDEPLSILSIEGAKDIAIELNSLSKSHNMAGWRVGMLAGNKENIKNILRFKSNMDSGMFKPVQEAAVKALEIPADWYKKLNEIYLRRREIVFGLLDLLHCSYDMEMQGMFVWAKIPDKYKNGYELSDKILDNTGVFITPGGIFGSQGDKYVRVSLSNDDALLETVVSRIREWVN